MYMNMIVEITVYFNSYCYNAIFIILCVYAAALRQWRTSVCMPATAITMVTYFIESSNSS